MRPVSFIFYFLIFTAQSVFGLSAIDSLKLKLLKTADDTNKVNMLNALSDQLLNISGFDSALKYSEEATRLAEKLFYKTGVASSANTAGMAYYNMGNYSESLKSYSLSLKMRQETGDKQGVGDSYNNMGLVLLDQGNYTEALKNYLEALRIYETLGDTKNGKKRVASAYINIGSIYLYQSNHEEALKNYFSALELMNGIDDKKGMADAYTNIGAIYYLQHKFDDALKNYQQSVSLRTVVGDRQGIADSYLNIGLIYYDQEKHEEALKNYLPALKIFEESGNKDGIAAAYTSIGDVYTQQKKYIEAKKYLEEGLKLSQEIGNKENIKTCYKSLSELAIATGDFRQGYAWQKQYSDLKDTLLNETNNKQIAEMKTRFETEKKEKENVTLTKDKEIQAIKIEKQRVTVQYLVAGFLLLGVSALLLFRFYNQKKKATFLHQVTETKMKALRAQMNPHFIYNSINSAYRYLQENDLKSAEDYLLSFSKLIRQVLENSLQNEVSLNEELRSLELYLALEAQRMNNRFVYKINVADDIDRENTLIPPLLIEPFVENSIWHGLKNKEGLGKITVNIQKDADMLKCVIEDNGVGRHQKEIKTSGEREKKQSLGMMLTKDRIVTMNQALSHKTSVNVIDLFDEMKKPAGVKVELSLPLMLND